MYALENVLRPYAWGSTTAIAGLLGRPASGGPEAELWIGAHPDSPSLASAAADDGGALGLDELIARDPEHFLGRESVAGFGPRLPFLLKVLAAERPLSLQVHPTLEQARAGFAREEAAGVGHGAATRNYKDDNHKPEMIFALTPFEALCGFRPAAGSRAVFQHLAGCFDQAGVELPRLIPELLADLAQPDEGAALQAAFERLIAGDDVAAATSAVVGLLAAGAPLGQHGAELGTAVNLNEEYPGDPGVLISLLLNRISLAPGEAVYLPAGNVHAYLHGLGIEVMASSDNVLRGGLTPKFVDVPELLKTVAFEAVGVPALQAETTMLDQELYRPPFREFQLQRIELAPGGDPVPLSQSGAAVLIVLEGAVVLDSPKGDLQLGRGGSAFIPAAEAPVNVHPAANAAGPVVAFAVTTGLG